MEKEELSRYGYIWGGRGKPAELAPTERRDPADPYCPKWCRYACTGAWRTGQCLIRIPEAARAIMTSPAEPVQICKNGKVIENGKHRL